jgi:hypothetical protein
MHIVGKVYQAAAAVSYMCCVTTGLAVMPEAATAMAACGTAAD